MVARYPLGFVLDPADLPLLGGKSVHLTADGYPRINVSKGAKALVHRLILGAPPFAGALADHIDGDPLNARRSNLRWVTKSLSAANRRGQTATRGIRHMTWTRKDGSVGESFYVHLTRDRIAAHTSFHPTLAEATAAWHMAYAAVYPGEPVRT